MDLLVIGGTVFLGRQTVDAALKRGWNVTMFNRGQTNADLFPDAEKLRGDRDGTLDALKGRTWDAVIDTCGYVPRIVRQSSEFLKHSVGHYTFISSISVYSEPKPGIGEDGAVGTMADESVEQVTGETYGALKVLCERTVEEVLPGRTLVIRPGLIVGPHDPTGRFTYWPVRATRGGKILAPRADLPVQVIDARDLADWNLDLAERKVTGIFNGTGPATPLTMKDTLGACITAAGVDAEPVWCDDEFLLAQKVGAWMELPLWLPGPEGLMSVDVSKALASGLKCRPIVEIARDTIASHKAGLTPTPEGVGLTAEREAAILAAR